MATDKEKQDPKDEPAPPPGFRQADTDVDDYPAWDFQEQGELRGEVVKLKSITLDRRGNDVEVRMAVVASEDGGHWSLWESANLKSFFDSIRAGSEILVQPAGTKSLSGGRTMKVYRAFYR